MKEDLLAVRRRHFGKPEGKYSHFRRLILLRCWKIVIFASLGRPSSPDHVISVPVAHVPAHAAARSWVLHSATGATINQLGSLNVSNSTFTPEFAITFYHKFSCASADCACGSCFGSVSC